MDDLLTISETARLAGVTTQAIYKRLDGDLKPFLTTVDKKKMLKNEALEVLQVNQFANKLPTIDNALQESITATLNMLREQIAVKDKQLEEKDRQLQARDIHITDLTARIEAAQELQKSSQILLAQKEQQLALPAPEPLPQKKSLFQKLFHKD